jgi:hypothetical protein
MAMVITDSQAECLRGLYFEYGMQPGVDFKLRDVFPARPDLRVALLELATLGAIWSNDAGMFHLTAASREEYLKWLEVVMTTGGERPR